MFPNVRLVIAAILASIVALCCGFGVFAALRVNNEPLSRLPAGAPLRFVADNAAPQSIALVAGGTFGPRFQSSKAQVAVVAARISTLDFDRRVDTGPLNSVARIGPAPEPAAAPDAQPASEPIAESAGPPASEPPQAPAAAASTAVPTQETPPAQQAQVPNAGPDGTTGSIDSTGAVSAVPASVSAATDASPDQVQPVEQTAPEMQMMPDTATNPDGDAGEIVAPPPPAAKPHRVVRPRARPMLPPTNQFAAFRSTNQYAAFPPANFQYAAQPAAQRQVLVQYRPVTRPAVAHAPPAKNSAVGGPFVSPPAQ